MKRFVLLLFLTLLPVTVSAQLYLAVDPDVSATEYMVEFDGSTYGPMLPVDLRPGDTLIMDIEPLVTVEVQHMVRAAALNPWGDMSEWSDPLEFMLTTTQTVIVRQQPNRPALLRLLSQ